MLLLLVALVVGLFIGAVGVGGILLIPALNVLAPMPLRAAMATALFTFIFTGVVGAFLFQRRGSVDWALTVPLCAGALAFGVLGAWANAYVETRPLALTLAALIVFAGVYTLAGGRAGSAVPYADRPRAQWALLFALGAITGFGSGLTGVGGPALAVPMMVVLGFPALAAVGASQVVQIVAALSGSVAFLAQGVVDLKVAAGLVLFEVAGVWLGVVIAHRVSARVLRGAVGVLCTAVGAALLVKTW